MIWYCGFRLRPFPRSPPISLAVLGAFGSLGGKTLRSKLPGQISFLTNDGSTDTVVYLIRHITMPTTRVLRSLATSAALVFLAACSGDFLTGPGVSKSVLVPPAHTPVLFVHGWNSSGAVWTTTINRFIADGYTPAELTTWSYNTAQSNAVTAQQISNKVDSILAATGAIKVDIITHSMGSLSARYYLKNLGGSFKVDALVTLGGPDHGTNTAFFCGQISCVEMRPGSSFIKNLNATDETPGGTRYATWRSPCDEVINPLSSPILSGGATNNQATCMRHSDLHESLAVYNAYKTWVH